MGLSHPPSLDVSPFGSMAKVFKRFVGSKLLTSTRSIRMIFQWLLPISVKEAAVINEANCQPARVRETFLQATALVFDSTNVEAGKVLDRHRSRPRIHIWSSRDARLYGSCSRDRAFLGATYHSNTGRISQCQARSASTEFHIFRNSIPIWRGGNRMPDQYLEIVNSRG